MENIVKHLQPRSWRTREMHERYAKERREQVELDECPLCTAVIKEEFIYWKLVPNKYPYDAVALIHDLIVPKRHAAWGELTEAELNELKELQQTIFPDRYTFSFEAFQKHRSVPGHFHLHLLVPKVID